MKGRAAVREWAVGWVGDGRLRLRAPPACALLRRNAPARPRKARRAAP